MRARMLPARSAAKRVASASKNSAVGMALMKLRLCVLAPLRGNSVPRSVAAPAR